MHTTLSWPRRAQRKRLYKRSAFIILVLILAYYGSADFSGLQLDNVFI